MLEESANQACNMKVGGEVALNQNCHKADCGHIFSPKTKKLDILSGMVNEMMHDK